MSTELKHIEIVRKIASGAFGEIYMAHDTNKNLLVAVKVEKRSHHAQIKHEYYVYSKIKGTLVPKVYTIGKVLIENIYLNCFVMELLGKSLEQLFVKCDRKFGVKSVCMLGVRMLEGIESLHNKHFIHRDIKPDNFVFDTSQKTLYLIDYGLAKEYRDPITLIHREIRHDRSLTGTARYTSIRCHQGVEQSRRDDLESLGYCLIYFLKGRLSWQGLRAESKQQKYEKIKQCKECINTWELCKDLPHEFYVYIFYVRNLEYDDWPNYEYLKDLFRTLLRKNGWRDDQRYDWTMEG